MRLTLSYVMNHQAKLEAAKLRKAGKAPAVSRAVEDESKLQKQIEAECMRRKWYYVRSRMDQATTQRVGVPDFIIAGDFGKTYWIEAKAKGKKPTFDQAGAIHWLKYLGHTAAVVWSFEEFLEIVK